MREPDTELAPRWATADTLLIALTALFVTALVTAQLVAVKVIALPLPVELPVVGGAIIAPAGVLAYALTFLASDCIAELYGRRPAQVVVNVGFGMNLVLLALVWLAIAAPGSGAGVDPATFRTAFGPSTNIVIGSLAAYVVSQNLDVLAFHAVRERTGGRLLWVRNVASTGTSQLVDTAVFISVAFWAVPATLGAGAALPPGVLLGLIAGQYLLKLLIALLDTPVVYAVVGYARSRGLAESPAAS